MQIIAEIGINHNGDIGLAKKLILMAKECGADYVKFQKRDIDLVYTKEFLDSIRESPWGNTQRHQKEGLEFGFTEYHEIDMYCNSVGINWFASAWDLNSLQFLEYFVPSINKVASAMLTNERFVEGVASLGRQTIISTGMSSWEVIDRVVDVFKYHKCPFVLLHCVSVYPCPDEICSLGMIPALKERYRCCEVGYSNHSPGIESCVGAAYLGAEWIECHITLDRSSYGSDQAASLERRGLELVVKYAKNAKKIIGDGVKIIRDAEVMNASKLRYWENDFIL